MESDIDELLKRIYQDPASTGGLGSVDRLYRAAIVENPKITKKRVVQFLSGVDEYTMHKPLRHKFERRPTLSPGLDAIWQIDLVIMPKLASFNDGYQNVLMAIDIFSRYGFAEPMVSKSAAEAARALEIIMQRSGRVPRKICSDKGTEFLGHDFQNFLRQRDIGFYETNSDKKAAVVERFNRTIKERMWRYFQAHGTSRYVDILQDLIGSYNRSKHRTIGMAPADVTRDNADELQTKVYDRLAARKPPRGKRYRPRFKVGDSVRLTQNRHVFAKGYEEKWTTELFYVDKVYAQEFPTMYRLRDYNKELIKGRFYERELQAVKPPLLYKIEKVLKRRRLRGRQPEVLIKWQGYGPEFNTWEPASEVVDL
jgi:transposase InsO family protein